MNLHKKSKGFTLLELLVVVAIIGILSAIVLASVDSARKKAKDAGVRESALQMRNLMEFEFGTSGSYTNLGTNWIPYGTSCAVQFNGTYATNMRDLCNNLVSNSGLPPIPPGVGDTRLYIDANSVNFSIVAWLVFKQKFLCVGSSGRSSETTTMAQAVANDYSAPSCIQNP